MATLQSGFTCQDFLPHCLDHGSIFKKPVYEPFSTLIVHANEWLRANHKWKVITCESVEFKHEGKDTDFIKMSYVEYGERITPYIRGLRLWLTELEKEKVREQQIGYLDLIPQELKKGGFFKSAVYETLDVVMEKFNSAIRFNPLPGKVISVETQKMKIDWPSKIDPHRSYWFVKADTSTNFVFVIRIFYEVMEGKPEEIALKDFVPDLLQSGGLLSMPKYEPFSSLVSKVSSWHAQHSDVRICNVQSVEIRRAGIAVDTQKMEYTQYGTGVTSYVRILRVAYVKSSLYPDVNALSVDRLACVNFLPEKIKSSIFFSTYEDFTIVKEKVSTWIKTTGAHVVCAETVHGWETKNTSEETYTVHNPERNKYWILFFRLYYSTA